MGSLDRFTSSFKGYSSLFWVANTLELFERFAFYGTKAVLAYFLAEKVGLSGEAGTLAGTFTMLVYGLPIFAGVVVDRYGFRRALMACFAIFCIGYFLIALAGMPWGESIMASVGKRTYVLFALTVTAIGGSLIKPCIVGTVARTTNDETKTQGFAIYYALVNFGGALGPVLALFIRTSFGFEWVLMVSSLTSALLFLGTYIFFKEPDGGAVAEKKTFADVTSGFFTVIKNGPFMLFLLIFSAFWVMFWQIFYLIPFYATKVLHFQEFELLESVDAWFIIFFALAMATAFKEWKPFTAMTFGFVVSSLSWFILVASGSTIAVVIGVIIFALGEGTQSPRFYEYVGSLAPPAQTGTYMGFAFLPVAVGAFLAGVVSDWLRLSYMDSNPSMMWTILGSIGVVSTILLIAYDRIFVKKSS